MIDRERDGIRALKNGDIAGLAVLVDLHQTRALRTAYRILQDAAAAEDVVADAFLTVCTRIGQYDERWPFAVWFYRIIVNHALNRVKREARIMRGATATAALLDQSDPLPGPEARFGRRESASEVRAAISLLPIKLRSVVVLRYYLDLNEREIAQVISCPVGTVKWRLFSARRRLRSLLEEQVEDAGQTIWKGEPCDSGTCDV